MHALPRKWPFILFFLSGFAGLVYQIVWLRLAFASFGVVTPVISVVLSVFMLGLGLGSWLAGILARRTDWSRPVALRVYALTEFLIGLGGILVPWIFGWGEQALLPAGESDSVAYLVSSAGAIALSLAPFCLCMGMTFPLMMQALRADDGGSDSFSYLYVANVLGAICGTLLTPLMFVELFGFRGTLALAVAANWVVAVASIVLSRRQVEQPIPELMSAAASKPEAPPLQRPPHRVPLVLWTLFTTGLASMGMEVVWTRAFTPVLTTQVYSFAGLLLTYLVATWCGSVLYRRELRHGRALSDGILLVVLSLAAFGQLVLWDPRLNVLTAWWKQVTWLLGGIVPYCAILGYLTPKLVDEYSAGEPGPAGKAYAVNVLGCILGPLVASYLLLPNLGVQWSGVLLAAPLWLLAGLGLRGGFSSAWDGVQVSQRNALWMWGTAGALGLVAALFMTSTEEQFAKPGAWVLRDHTATVIATEYGERKDLYINGINITSITPTTKLMAHLPLAHLSEPPESALVICFGMGTTYRSLLSWNIKTIAVELVPSVRDAFGYYFDDAEQVKNNPLGTIVIDDGRRFLKRTTETFDVITIDPPPPVEAAASSLLYSQEFYQLLKPRLKEHGILQQWFPGGERKTFQAVLRALNTEFPYVRAFRAVDVAGFHMLASRVPIPRRSAAELLALMPESAQVDMIEWSSDHTEEEHFQFLLEREIDVGHLLQTNLGLILTDNRPYNEYYLMRRFFRWLAGSTMERI